MSSGQLADLQISELCPGKEVMRLQGYISGLLASALVVVDELSIQRHTNSRSVRLDDVVVPSTDLDLGRCGRRLQIVNRARDFQRMTFGVRN